MFVSVSLSQFALSACMYVSACDVYKRKKTKARMVVSKIFLPILDHRKQTIIQLPRSGVTPEEKRIRVCHMILGER